MTNENNEFFFMSDSATLQSQWSKYQSGLNYFNVSNVSNGVIASSDQSITTTNAVVTKSISLPVESTEGITYLSYVYK